MEEKKTTAIASDPVFFEELSGYLEVLANPLRLKILRFIGDGPKEMTVIAGHTGLSYQTAKKHLDRLVATGLVQRAAGFGRETERGIAPVWKYSLAPGALTDLAATLGVFSGIAAPMGYSDIRDRIRAIRRDLAPAGSMEGPVLYLVSGPAEGRAFVLGTGRIPVGREDPAHPEGTDGMVVLPDGYRAVTRVTKPHAVIEGTAGSWQVGDNGSTGGTFLNGRRLGPRETAPLASGDVIDLSIGADAARLLFIADE